MGRFTYPWCSAGALRAPELRFELKGLQVTKYDMTTSNNVKGILNNTSLDQHKCLNNNCFAVAFYSICYSIISSCSYWNSKTLDAIIQNGSQLNNVIKSRLSLIVRVTIVLNRTVVVDSD